MAGSRFSPAVIYIFLAILLLHVFSSRTRPRAHRRLLRSPGFPFDPLLSDLDHRGDDRAWEQAHIAGVSDPKNSLLEDDLIFPDEERFNLTGRIVALFPEIDLNPRDGRISINELVEWTRKQAEREACHRAEREMELRDLNRDGLVSFSEFALSNPDSHGLGDDKNPLVQIGWWEVDHFNAADADGDGLLNLTEYKDFQNPAESSNQKLIRWLCKKEIRKADEDKDGKLDFWEFRTLQVLIQNNTDSYVYSGQHNHEMEASAVKMFLQIDKDKDGFLSENELINVVADLHPSGQYYAKEQAHYVISEADADGDGYLSLTEMLADPDVFYSGMSSDDEGDHYLNHDELR